MELYKLITSLLVISIIFVSGCVSQNSSSTQETSQQSTQQTSTKETTSIQPKVFSNLKEIFQSNNPVGNNVKLHGIGLKISGVSVANFFLFTDDERVMNNPSYIIYYGSEYEIVVYNIPKNAGFEQNLLNITGKVVNCKRSSDGKFCIEASSIEVVSTMISAD